MWKRIPSFILIAALGCAGIGCWADEANVTGNNNNPMEHPVNAYTNHEVNADMKDSKEYSQKAAEAKATYKQAKADYDKSLKNNGADSQVTKDAQKRMHDAHLAMHKYNKKTAKANQDMKADETKAQQ